MNIYCSLLKQWSRHAFFADQILLSCLRTPPKPSGHSVTSAKQQKPCFVLSNTTTSWVWCVPMESVFREHFLADGFYCCDTLSLKLVGEPVDFSWLVRQRSWSLSSDTFHSVFCACVCVCFAFSFFLHSCRQLTFFSISSQRRNPRFQWLCHHVPLDAYVHHEPGHTNKQTNKREQVITSTVSNIVTSSIFLVLVQNAVVVRPAVNDKRKMFLFFSQLVR